MSEMSMIERVARSLYSRTPALVLLPGTEGGMIPWEMLSAEDLEPYYADARLALAAMREPTPEMLEAGQKAELWTMEDGFARLAVNVWQAMIGAAP